MQRKKRLSGRGIEECSGSVKLHFFLIAARQVRWTCGWLGDASPNPAT